MMATEVESIQSPLESIGHKTSTIPVELSLRFLEHFSEQMYSSPQKAFEELIANGWDAGADVVDVRVSTDRQDPGATMCVLDNGDSMDEEGLRQLWHIAFSPKTDQPNHRGRQVIGKFGIGKLATFVLAQKLTYICKADDGKIRRVTMDYTKIDPDGGATSESLIKDLTLDVYDVTMDEVEQAWGSVFNGNHIIDLIRNGVPKQEIELPTNDYGGGDINLDPTENDTWTLVVLSDLKPTGRELRIGILRRMLQAALPIGSEMAIVLNGHVLVPSKIDSPILAEWSIGPNLPIDHIVLEESDLDHKLDIQPDSEDDQKDSTPGKVKTRIALTAGGVPYPYIDIDGLGKITGKVWLFEDKISGGVSDERGASNGFHVNVLGRVVNQNDPSFGEEDLNHAAWSRFRMTVRVDGLNSFLTIDREKFKEKRELRIFRAFLRRVFNLVRTTYDDDKNAVMPDGGDVLVQSLGILSLSPLRSIVADSLKTAPPIAGLIDDEGIDDRAAQLVSWRQNTADNIKNAVSKVRYEKTDDDNLVKFRISDNTIVVNKDHPFVLEHARTKAEKELVRTIAMVNLLSDMYALELGIPPATLISIRDYRDRLMKFRALQARDSGIHIAKLLLQTQHDSDNSERLEKVVSDALRYIGFDVRDLAASGEPEGIASAYPLPSESNPNTNDPNPPLYSFSFDAKSSKWKAAKTGNIKLDAIVEHRDRYNADYALGNSSWL